MKLKSSALLTGFLGLLGLGGFVALYSDETIKQLVKLTHKDTGNTIFAEGETCSLFAQDYMQNLEKGSDGEVFSAGCGGIF